MSEPAPKARLYTFVPSTPATPLSRVRRAGLEIAASTDQTLRNPEGLTAATNGHEDDEYSDENLRMWEEEDRLNPELAEWLKAQLRE